MVVGNAVRMTDGWPTDVVTMPYNTTRSLCTHTQSLCQCEYEYECEFERACVMCIHTCVHLCYTRIRSLIACYCCTRSCARDFDYRLSVPIIDGIDI